MAKAVVWGGMLIVAVSGMFYGMKMLNADPGQTVGYAVGAPDANNECDLQVVVSTIMNFTDGPTQTVSPTSKTPDWEHWAKSHFILTDDATGQVIDFRKGGFKSSDIDENQFGASELIMHATLEAGKHYTFRFVPIAGQPEEYVEPIVGEARAFQRATFEPAY